jgi:hypothetical protein
MRIDDNVSPTVRQMRSCVRWIESLAMVPGAPYAQQLRDAAARVAVASLRRAADEARRPGAYQYRPTRAQYMPPGAVENLESWHELARQVRS